ncbi:ribonuclease P 40kDa subunit-domain-containing protein [Pisolithus marmoratus]|nr:ribonuclease P 40kDa subunit-domain-containing protein [Pisolithus marmoratus]
MQSSRVMIGSGELPSSQLDNVAATRPFVQQIDVVFPSSEHFETELSSLVTSCNRAHFTLSELFEQASHDSGTNKLLKALPITCDPDGTWCIDPRGVLTLCVSKQLYQRLGLVGKKLPFKGCQELHAIKIPLRQNIESIAMRSRQLTAIKTWDELRAQRGLGKWEITFIGGGPATKPSPEAINVRPQVLRYVDMFVPVPGTIIGKEMNPEDWEERASEIFEWAGMACLGAQRLKANDRVDPYVAVYEVPTPSRVGSLTHIRWRGTMASTFVQSVLTTAMSLVTACPSGDNSLISLTMHCDPTAPVSYITPGLTEMDDTPLRVPRSDGEDTLCLILTNNTWISGQSTGKWDARWG